MRTIAPFLLLAACASSRPAPSGAPAQVRRSIVFHGHRVGSSVVTREADGTLSNVVDIHDNGRGPHADARMRLAPDGTLAELRATGHTELNAPVDERFSVAGGRARWDSLEEHGSAALSGPAFFIPNSAADADALLLSALLRLGGTLSVLPAGTARLERVGEATATAGGKAERFVAYAITGLDFLPRYLWAREDGTFFAEVAPGFWFGEEGKEDAAEALTARQEELRRARDRELSERLGRKPPAAGFALTHARVLDVEKGVWLADQTVAMAGGVIRAVGSSPPPAGAQVIDLAGKAVLPGLWDMHAHLSPPDGPLNIASGVTTVRDVGNTPDLVDDFKKRFDEGSAVGPHVLRAGFIEGRGPDAAHAEVTATTPDEARAAVAFYAGRRYEMIKIYNSIDPALVPVLAREAHARGMGVTGHVPAHMLAAEAVRAGYDGIEHINQLMLNFFADHQTDTRTPLRFSLVGDRAAGFDPRSKPSQDFYALLRERGTVIDPTYVTFEPVYVAEQGQVLPGWTRTVERLPPQARRFFLIGGLPLSGKKELYARSWEAMLRMAKVLHDEGVPVVAGTDYLAGLSLHRELELLVQGGLTPLQALQAATVVPARAMKASAASGSIAAGKAADLMVVDGDPLASIADVRKTVLTFRSGVLYRAAEVYAAVGVAPESAAQPAAGR